MAWIATLPGFLAVALLAGFVKEPKGHAKTSGAKIEPVRLRISAQALRHFDTRFWWVVVFGALLSLARFSEAFLILRGPTTGLRNEDAPILMVIMNLVYVLTAYPVGHLSDRLGRGGLLAAGISVLILADLVLAGSHSPGQTMLGVGLWGLQMGLTQGLLSAMVADAAPTDMRGTAFGLFNLAGGIATLSASVIAGLAWERFGAPATFMTGAVFATGALLLFWLSRPWR